MLRSCQCDRVIRVTYSDTRAWSLDWDGASTEPRPEAAAHCTRLRGAGADEAAGPQQLCRAPSAAHAGTEVGL